MNPYFRNPDRIAAIQREALSWKGTPFLDGIGRRAKKGTACDCVSWVAAALQSTGAIGAVPWPRNYVSMTGGPEMLAVLINVLGNVERLHCLWALPSPLSLKPALVPGDILCGTTGRAQHHLALFIGDNTIVHCWAGQVGLGNPYDTMLCKHLHSIWRAYE